MQNYLKKIGCFDLGEKEDVKKVIAFDVGGTSIRAAIVSGNKISNYMRVDTPKEKGAFLAQVDKFIEALISKDIKGIGIAFPASLKEGFVKNAPNLPIHNFDLKGYLEKRYKKRVDIANDAGCVALAEARLGCKKKNFFVLTLGTGIGGGIVINGENYRGGGYGAELGHIIIEGRFMEDLWKEAKAQIRREFGQDMLVKDVVKINSLRARKILRDAAVYLGQGIASLITALDPEIVIMGGGVKDSGTAFLNMIKEQVEKYYFLPHKVPIVWTKLDKPGILGASLLVI